MNKVICTLLASGLVLGSMGEAVRTNVYEKVASVFADDGGLVPGPTFYSVKGGGFSSERMTDDFASLCEVVSNNATHILADWTAYATNAVAQFSVLNALCFSGECVYTNSLSVLLSRQDNVAVSSWQSLKFLAMPYGTPMQRHLLLHYDVEGVSNLVLRVKQAALSAGDNDMVLHCEEILTGEARGEYLELKAAGAL